MFPDSNRWFGYGVGARRDCALHLRAHVESLDLVGWSAALVAHIDKVVRPYVISERAKMHPLLIFFALLGGVSAFGVMGLFIGPLVMSLTLIVLELLSEGNLDESAASNGRC